MKTKQLLKIVEPYCDKIIYNGNHHKLYIKDTNKIIVVSHTSSDRYYHTQVFRDFRRLEIIIKELNKN